MLDRLTPPKLYPTRLPSFTIPEPLLLSNGIPVYLIEDDQAGITCIDWVSGNGFANERRPRSTYFSLEQMTSGTRQMDAKTIAETLELLGAYYTHHVSADSCGYTIYSITRNIERTLSLWANLIKDASFPERELAISKSRHIEALKVSLEKTDVLANRHFVQLLYGSNHPYGFITTPEIFESIQPADLSRTNWLTNGGHVIVSGGIPKNSYEILDKTIGQIAVSTSGAVVEPSFGTPSQHLHLNKSGAVQAAVRIGKTVPPRIHPDYPGFYLASVVLGGYFGSRLMKNIREDKGLTYGIYATIHADKQQGRFVIGSEFRGDLTAVVRKEIEHEMEALATKPMPDEEVDTVRNYLLGSLARSSDNVFGRATRLKNMLFHGLSSSDFDEFARFIQTFDANSVLVAADKLFNPEQLSSVVVGPQDTRE